MTIWYILCSLGAFCPVLVLCTKKNLATLEPTWRGINSRALLPIDKTRNEVSCAELRSRDVRGVNVMISEINFGPKRKTFWEISAQNKETNAKR
jgi:hypothetical protein